MLTRFVLTVTRAPSEKEARRFFIDQIYQEYGDVAGHIAEKQPFKRVLMAHPSIPAHLNHRFKVLEKTGASAPFEYIWRGPDSEDDTSSYVLYGLVLASEEEVI